MSYRKHKLSKRVELPLTGSTVVQVSAPNLVRLIFEDPQGVAAELRFEHEVLLCVPNGGTVTIKATKPGLSFDPVLAVESLLPLLGKVVRTAVAHRQGKLEIEFYEGDQLLVIPKQYEAWHFQKPAVPVRRAHSATMRLTGSDGELL